jgi:hypothetical protein
LLKGAIGMATFHRTSEDRFWAKVRKTETCWLWTGATAKGYGVFGVDRRMRMAHRIALEFSGIAVPAAGVVCHRCDTPLCVRPDHLFVGTKRDNSQDALRKGRLVTTRRKLSGEQIGELLRLRADGAGLRELAAHFGVASSTIHAAIKRSGLGK